MAGHNFVTMQIPKLMKEKIASFRLYDGEPMWKVLMRIIAFYELKKDSSSNMGYVQYHLKKLTESLGLDYTEPEAEEKKARK